MRRYLALLPLLFLLSLPTVARALTVTDPPRHFQIDLTRPNSHPCRLRPATPPDSDLCPNAAPRDPPATDPPAAASPEEVFAGTIDHGAWQVSLQIVRVKVNDHELGKDDVAHFGAGLFKGIEGNVPEGALVSGDATPKESRVGEVQVLENTATVEVPGGKSTSFVIASAVTGEGLYEMIFTADRRHAAELAADAAAVLGTLRATPATRPPGTAFQLGFAVGFMLPFCLVGGAGAVVLWVVLRRRGKATA